MSRMEALKQATAELAPRRMLMTSAGYKQALKVREHEIDGFCLMRDRALFVFPDATRSMASPGIAQLHK